MMYKRIILVIVISLSEISCGLERMFNPPNTNYIPMFLESYKHVRKWEGNYSWLKDDIGGETYAGIARKFNKDWEGWEVLDEYKEDSVVYWNKRIEDLEMHVMEYYYSVWINDGYHKIENETVRDYLFDYRNAGKIAYIHTKKVLDEMGFCVSSGSTMDDVTINAINKSNPEIFIERLQRIRKTYYEGVADRKPEMKKYLKGWINRANNIIA